MALNQITYTDKVENNGATDDGKVLATNMNEIKTVTNGAIDAIENDVVPIAGNASNPMTGSLLGNGTSIGGFGNIELGIGGADASPYIDFLSSSDPSQADYSARIIRNSGVDGHLEIANIGSGDIRFNTGGNIALWGADVIDCQLARITSVSDASAQYDAVNLQTLEGITASTEVKIGSSAGATNQGADSVAVGLQAGRTNQGTLATAVGRYAGETSQGINSVAVGNLAGRTSQGVNSISAGYLAGNSSQGSNSVAVGTNAGKTTQGASSVAMGYLAGETSLGLGSVVVGLQAGQNATASYNTFIGRLSGQNATGGTNSCLGNTAGSSLTTQTNSTCLGHNTQVTASNQVQLGNSSTTTYAYGAVQDRSDLRDKADVQDVHLGLEFLEALTPRSYKFDYREDYREHTTELQDVVTGQDEDGNDITEEQEVFVADTRKLGEIEHDGTHVRSRLHCGLVAQEVKQVMDDLGVDFAGYQDHGIAGGDDVLSIGYGELISPMIKAIQELSARVKELESA